MGSAPLVPTLVGKGTPHLSEGEQSPETRKVFKTFRVLFYVLRAFSGISAGRHRKTLRLGRKVFGKLFIFHFFTNRNREQIWFCRYGRAKADYLSPKSNSTPSWRRVVVSLSNRHPVAISPR